MDSWKRQEVMKSIERDVDFQKNKKNPVTNNNGDKQITINGNIANNSQDEIINKPLEPKLSNQQEAKLDRDYQAYKSNVVTFAQLNVQDKKESTQKISFKSSFQKNFNLEKYGKMETNIAWVKILAIMLVVLTHTIQSSLSFAGVNGGSIVKLVGVIGDNAYALHFFQILSIPCVNLFVVVSCFLENKSMKIKFYKLIKMYLLITFILLMMTAIKWAIWPDKINIQEWVNAIIWFYIEDPWYFTAYFAFLLIVPFVNYMFKKLTLNGVNVAFIVVIIVFLLWKLLTILFGTGLWDGSTGIVPVSTKIKDAVTNRGYNVINFLVIYVVVQWIVRHNFFARFKWYGWLTLWVVNFGIQYLMVVWSYSNMLYEYSNPFVIISAISLFGLFYNIKMKKNAYVNYISTLTMFIFLFHWNALGKTFILADSTNSDLGNMWLTNIMQTLLYQKTVFMCGLWVADPQLWPLHVLLIFAVLFLALLMISIAFDMLCRFVTAIPAWIKFVQWNKDLLQLDRFENLFIDDVKPQAQTVKA